MLQSISSNKIAKVCEVLIFFLQQYKQVLVQYTSVEIASHPLTVAIRTVYILIKWLYRTKGSTKCRNLSSVMSCQALRCLILCTGRFRTLESLPDGRCFHQSERINRSYLIYVVSINLRNVLLLKCI